MPHTPCPPYAKARTLDSQSGAALVFYIITLVLLSTLAAAMLTLFSTAGKIATDINHYKLAYYMAESGVRYAQSQMKLRGYKIDQKMGNINGIPEYKVEDGKSFKLEVSTMGSLESTNTDHIAGGEEITLKQPGDAPFPENYNIPSFGNSADSVYLISSVDLDRIIEQNDAEIIGSRLSSDRRRVYLKLQDSLIPDQVGRRYLGVQCVTGAQTVREGGSVTINAGGEIFPEKYGSITIFSHDYVYDKREDNGDGTYTLTNLHKPTDESGNTQTWESGWAPDNGDDLKNLGNGDFVILSSENNLNVYVTSTGISGPDKVEKSITATFYVAEDGRKPKDAITFDEPHTIVSSDPTTDPVELTEDPGLNLGAGVYYTFGAIWYSGTKHGVGIYCVDGACDFGLGLRSFFTIEFDEEQADGFVFAVTNGVDNGTTACGGDSDLGELMAFAGDSRVYKNNPIDPSKPIDFWVDPERNGIQPPKFGVEFDTFRNSPYNEYNPYDPRRCVCNNKAGTRIDPGDEYYDTAQHKHIGLVYWGDDLESGCANQFNCFKEYSPTYSYTETGLNTYDDNKHNAGLNTDTDAVFEASSDIQRWYSINDNYIYATRIEMHRSLKAVDDEESENYGKYEYTNKVWVHSCGQSSNCNEYVGVAGTLWDLEGDFEINPTDNPDARYYYYYPVLEQTFYLSQAEHDKLDTVFIGFTEATGYYTQRVKLRNYKTVFRAGGDEDIIDLP